MLRAFGVRNYYNLNMANPIVFQEGISFIYGTCSSGKTNLCRALGDIINFCYHRWENKEPQFYYHFICRGYDLVYNYERDCRGRVNSASIMIPQLEFVFNFAESLQSPMDIFRICRASEREPTVYSVVRMFEQYIQNEFRVIVPECKTALQTNLSNDQPQEDEIDIENIIVKEPGRLTLIIDDFEYNGMQDSQLLAYSIMSCRQQAVVIVRRSKWIDCMYGGTDHYYFIKNGDLIPALNYLRKDIRSVKQLKNLFLKGSFGV